MTKEQFALKHKHRLMGMMLDCYTNGHRRGAEASMMLSAIQNQVQQIIDQMYDDLNPKPAPPAQPEGTANGKPNGSGGMATRSRV